MFGQDAALSLAPQRWCLVLRDCSRPGVSNDVRRVEVVLEERAEQRSLGEED